MDLDGVPDFFSESLPGGGRRDWADMDGDGRMEWVLQQDAAGNERQEFDADQNGVVDEVRTRTVGPPEQLVVLTDSDWDGRLERRTTVTFNPSGKRVVEEADPDGDDVFTLISDDTLPPYMSLQVPLRPDSGHAGAPSDASTDAGL